MLPHKHAEKTQHTLCFPATEFNPWKPAPRVDAIVDVGGCVQCR